MQNRGTIIYTGAFRFPMGDAAAARVLGIGKALRDAGYKVVFAGSEASERPKDIQPDGSYSFQGFVYKSQDEFRHGYLSPAARLFNFLLTGRKTAKWLKSAVATGVDIGGRCDDLRAVIAYGFYSGFVLRMGSFCRQAGAKLVVDCAEWYDSGQLPGGRLGLVRWDGELRMRLVNRGARNVIAISGYLEDYYSSRGCDTIWVPPLIDIEDAKWSQQDAPRRDGALRLVYAGIPAKKDLIGNAILGIDQLRREGIDVTLDMIGPSVEELETCLGDNASVLSRLTDSVICHGRIPQDKVPAALERADFSILLRPQKRYAQAGFSTKLVESLAAGVPVIANATGDIPKFVHDGHECILAADHTVAGFVDAVRRVVQLPREQWRAMRVNARQTAAESFDYRKYAEPLGSFIEAAR